MRIPITICHGITAPDTDHDKPLTVEHMDRLMRIASEMGFQSIGYDELDAWRAGTGHLPERPIMLDFDHPVRSMRYEVRGVLDRYGFRGNLFIQTAPLVEPPLKDEAKHWITWDELGELRDAGWCIGAHTHSHPSLSKLSVEDPTGEKLRAELDRNDALIKKHLGITPRDFAFTGTSFSTQAGKEVEKRYRFGRLWITGSPYQVDGKTVRYADLVGMPGPDLPDGGPPLAARYITRHTHPYRLPSMEIQALIHTEEAFRAYLEGASAEGGDAPA